MISPIRETAPVGHHSSKAEGGAGGGEGDGGHLARASPPPDEAAKGSTAPRHLLRSQPSALSAAARRWRDVRAGSTPRHTRALCTSAVCLKCSLVTAVQATRSRASGSARRLSEL
eukprot:scaffold62300_cov75-Phaeocystis_antarctica.AAC.4